MEAPKFCHKHCFCLEKVGQILPSFSLVGSVIVQCWTKCEGGGAPGCLEVIVEVVELLLALSGKAAAVHTLLTWKSFQGGTPQQCLFEGAESSSD